MELGGAAKVPSTFLVDSPGWSLDDVPPRCRLRRPASQGEYRAGQDVHSSFWHEHHLPIQLRATARLAARYCASIGYRR